MKILTFAILSLLLINIGQAQTRNSPYRQFLTNPYLFNPAFVGINNQSEVNLVYRQQWVNFKDAPVLMGVNLQFPTNNRVAIGLNLTTDKQVLLRNSTFMGTFGYIIPFSETQSLRFGISAGVGMNSLDLNAEELNSNDPALLNAVNTNFYVDGNVGVVYANSGLKFGFAFTDIFNSKSFNTETFNKFALSNLKNRVYSMSYRFNVGVMEDVALEPYFLYRQSADGLQNSWEAASLIYFKDKIWTGAGYNQNNGLALFLGMNVKEKFRFNYSYEFPPFKSGVTATSSHELHLSLKFGKKKTTTSFVQNKSRRPSYMNKTKYYKRKPAPKLVKSKVNPKRVKTVNTNKGATKPAAQNELAESKKNPEDKVIPNPAETIDPKTTGSPAKSFTISKGNYLVVAVFSSLDHSTKFTTELAKDGYFVNVALNPKNKFYYVYIYSSYNIEEVKKMRDQYRRRNPFKEAWVFTMD